MFSKDIAVVIHNHPRLPYHTSFIKLIYNELHAPPPPTSPRHFPSTLHCLRYTGIKSFAAPFIRQKENDVRVASMKGQTNPVTEQ